MKHIKQQKLVGIFVPCSRCGKEVYPLCSMPTKVSRITHKIKHLEWVCKNCLTPKEKWLLKLREYELQPKEKPKISEVEYNKLFFTADWNCPVGVKEPRNCDGHPCPSKPKPRCHYGQCSLNPETCGGPTASCYDDYYQHCLESLEARAKIIKVWRGDIEIG